MNDYGIPIIEPTVDFTKVPPIHQKRTITFVNHFIIQTVTFLNDFALCCEEKLFEFENKLQRVEASLEILESRLSSIPEIDTLPKTEIPIKKEVEINNQVETEQEAKRPDVVASSEAADVSSEEKKIDNSNFQPICKDPKYAKYFKLVQVRVPIQAVKLKMQQEGLDPLILDNPDLMVPITEVVNTNTTADKGDA